MLEGLLKVMLGVVVLGVALSLNVLSEVIHDFYIRHKS